MICRTVALSTIGMIAALIPVPSFAQGAPSQLYGKSITVAWTENRMQRREGSGAEFKPRGIAQSLSVYISSQGRLFSRRTARGKGGGGKRENVGEGGQSPTGGLLSTRFQAGTLVVSAELGGGARLITASFDNGFSGCTGNVRMAREAGRETMRIKSFADGGTIEVQSVTATSATCSIKEGNVFGE